MRHLLVMMVALALPGLWSCSRDARYPGSDLTPDEAAATERIAMMRFERERTCRPSARSAERLRALRVSTVQEISSSSCRSRIHRRDLERCISGIRGWSCDVDLSKVAVIEACKVDTLCGGGAEETL